MNVFRTSEYGIDNTGATLVTAQLQDLIDRAAAEKGSVIVEKGIYLTAALYLGSEMEFVLEEGATLLATTDESQYPIVPTRIAGVEMDWYPGLLNCSRQKHVTVRGKGVINCQGPYWWAKFWGTDLKGGLLAEYEPRGLRWATDYDAMRLRSVVVSNSEDIKLRDFTLEQGGFWNLHVFYSDNVHIDGVKILCPSVLGPSTDGIDIDSSRDVLIENCEIHVHDDNISIKSGRDSDGLRVNIPCERVRIRSCRFYEGYGIALGSEVSGGVEDITVENVQFFGTEAAITVKSNYKRKGYIRKILFDNIEMTDVRHPICIQLDWFRKYNTCTVPEDYTGEIPDRWKKLMAPVPDEIPPTVLEDFTISNVHAVLTKDFEGDCEAILINGFPEAPIPDMTLRDVQIDCRTYGTIQNIANLRMENVTVRVTDGSREIADPFTEIYYNENK